MGKFILILSMWLYQIEKGLMEAKVASGEDFPAKIANIQFAIVAINALSKVCTPLLLVCPEKTFLYSY